MLITHFMGFLVAITYSEYFVYLSDQSAGHVLLMFIFLFMCVFNELIYVYFCFLLSLWLFIDLVCG